MAEWIINEWQQRGLGVLIVGGQAMIADGLREHTKDLDACVSAPQHSRMLEWFAEKDRQGRRVDIRAGSAPLHPEWLGRGWTFHVEIGEVDRVDLFGVPLRAPNRLVERFFDSPMQISLASLAELGSLKRTERAQDWADIDLIVGRLRERHDDDAVTLHLFGNALVDELTEHRGQESFRSALEQSQQAEDRPILRLGLKVPLDEFRAMARAEQRFWEIAGALRSDEIKDRLKRFWRKHLQSLRAGVTFPERHAILLAAAQADLPKRPVEDPAALIEAARTESGAARWPELLPPTDALVAQYFPEYREHLGARLRGEFK